MRVCIYTCIGCTKLREGDVRLPLGILTIKSKQFFKHPSNNSTTNIGVTIQLNPVRLESFSVFSILFICDGTSVVVHAQ